MKTQNKDNIPESEEDRFKLKCRELKRRVLEIEESNEIATIALNRTQSSIRRLRLEYTILLERLETRVNQLPDSLNSFEEMAGPPTPAMLDDSIVKSRNGKKATKRPTKSTDSKNTNLAKRDPDLPKRPTNAYLIFCEQEKERLKSDPDHIPHDLSKNMTENWKNLTEEDKKPYFKLYEDDKIRYQKEMEVYNSKKHPNEDGEDKKDTKKQKVRKEDGGDETPGVEQDTSVIIEHEHEQDQKHAQDQKHVQEQSQIKQEEVDNIVKIDLEPSVE
ncbi:unnamed protein product [Candida verbasci]|uniref:HMG box domain-containing protein n=1 Tax=Candida verbasci TaxID=1227364 RepID=A0A9W4XLR4_9ASCO|nr:unnamed protein product [Candida verbasci]